MRRWFQIGWKQGGRQLIPLMWEFQQKNKREYPAKGARIQTWYGWINRLLFGLYFPEKLIFRSGCRHGFSYSRATPCGRFWTGFEDNSRGIRTYSIKPGTSPYLIPNLNLWKRFATLFRFEEKTNSIWRRRQIQWQSSHIERLSLPVPAPRKPRVRETLMDFRFSDEFNPNLRYSYRESPVLERNFKVEVRSQKRPKLLLNRLLLPDDIHQYDQFHKRIVASLWPRLIILWIPSWKQIYQFNLFKNTLSGREHNYLKSDGIKRHWVVKICIDTVVF